MSSHILIADDYEDNRELLRLILVTAGYEVIEARDGAECVQLAKDHLPNLIMLDLSMPKLDGWEVFRALSADSLTAEIPCIAVTAYAEIDRKRALKVGFKDYLAKPFRTGELLETVDRLLTGRSIAVSVADERSTDFSL